MLANLSGWHLLIMAAVGFVIVAIVVAVVVLAIVYSRRNANPPAGYPDPTAMPSAESRLRDIENLHQRGILTDAEYEAKRAEIIGRI